MKQMLFIVNPRSGRTQIKNRLLEILDLFTREGFYVQIHITQYAGDATDTVLREGAGKDLIVCSGGDGTLNETISGMMELDECPPLGYIPAGSTNDYASSLKIPRQILPAALAAITGSRYPVDVGYFCNESYFIYLAGFGAFTEVSYLTSQDRKNLLGHQAYMLESVKSLTAIKSYHMQIYWEDEKLEGDFIFGMITNTISVGGFKGLVNQNVALNDGLFEVLLIRTPKTPLELSGIATSLFMKEERNDLVYKFKASSLHIVSKEPVDWVLDGEFGGRRTEVSVENLYKRIEICRDLT